MAVMALKRKELYEFDGFRLDVDEHSLTRTDGSNNGHLPEKAFQTLVILVRNSGRLVKKQELIDQIWPDSFVEENSLDKCVHSVRKFLGDTRGEQRFIETVRKHGYRFVAPVSTFASNEDEPDIDETFSETTPQPTGTLPGSAIIAESNVAFREGVQAIEHTSSRPTRPFWSVRRWSIAAMLAVAIIAPLAYFTAFRPADGSTVKARRSIAVLPPNPIDPANRSEFYEMGVADLLILRLSSSKSFIVRPLALMRKYSDPSEDPLAVGRKLQVDHVVTLNYQLAQGRIMVTSQFLDVATGKVDEAFSVTADSSNVFAVQESIADAVTKRFLARYSPNETEVHSKRGTKNDEAYRFYLLAMNLSEERGRDNLLKSLEYVDRAVALDPNYARAWAAKAHIHGDLVGHSAANPHEHFPKAAEAITKALEIDPNLAEAYSALCHKENRYDYDIVAAEAACKRAVELDPNSSAAHRTYANFLYSRGRFDESIAEIRTAIDLQPISLNNHQTYGLALYFSRRYPDAQEQFERLLELSPTHNYLRGRLVLALEQQGKESEAFEHFVEFMSAQGTDREEMDRYKRAFLTAGWRGVVAERIKTAEAASSGRSFELGRLYAQLGNNEMALEYLEKAYQERSFLMATVKVDPQLDSLHGDPRFDDLARRAGYR